MNGALTTDDVRRFASDLGSIAPASSDAERIDRLRLFEQVKAALSAEQAITAVEFARSQEAEQAEQAQQAEQAEQAAAGAPERDRHRGVASQIGLALRVSPARAQRWLGWAKILIAELPETYAQLRSGTTTEWRTMLVARETAVLSREDRTLADAEIGPRLHECGDRQAETETRRIAYRLDPRAAVERARRAEAERRVTLRPVPDTMSCLSTLLPVAQGAAALAALGKYADSCIAVGDERGRGQIMADTLVERVTGQASADAVGVDVELVITDQTLLGSGEAADEPAEVIGYGPIPAGVARELALGRDGQHAPRWLRRLITSPDCSELISMESRRRVFTDAQRTFLRLRDCTCRTPYCAAPVRHADHVTAYVDGGWTSIGNGQGLCVACNLAKFAPGWSAYVDVDGRVVTRTPTGHRYTSTAPPPPGGRRPPDVTQLRTVDMSWPETRVLGWLRAA